MIRMRGSEYLETWTRISSVEALSTKYRTNQNVSIQQTRQEAVDNVATAVSNGYDADCNCISHCSLVLYEIIYGPRGNSPR